MAELGDPDRDAEPEEGGLRERVADLAGRVGEGVSEAVEGVRERASEVSHAAGAGLTRAGDTIREAGGAVRHRAGAARRSAAGTGRDMRHGLDTLIEDQPLVAGAIAMALGAAVGGALPRSRVEDRMFGEQSDRAMETVRTLAKDQGAKVQATASAVVDEALSIADEASAELGAKLPSGEEIVDAAESKVREAASRLREASGVETSRSLATARQDRTVPGDGEVGPKPPRRGPEGRPDCPFTGAAVQTPFGGLLRNAWIRRGLKVAHPHLEDTMAEKTFETLFHDTLRDIYYAERNILKALPKMQRGAQAAELKQAFETHKAETEGHVERLQQVFEIIGKRAQGKTCPAIDGIIEEGEEVMSEYKGTPALDAGLIAAAQAVEHYEITRYGTLKRWAEVLGMADAAKLLDATLQEEAKTDEALTGLADAAANQKAVAAE